MCVWPIIAHRANRLRVLRTYMHDKFVEIHLPIAVLICFVELSRLALHVLTRLLPQAPRTLRASALPRRRRRQNTSRNPTSCCKTRLNVLHRALSCVGHFLIT